MKKYPLLFSFLVILFGLTIFDIVKPDKEFSELENRKLKQEVPFTLKDFMKGSFSKNYEEYINDQFVARDGWIDLKSRSEYVLGKIENNGIIYGEDHYLFDKFNTVDKDRLNLNTASVEKFMESFGDITSVMLVPNSYVVYEDLMPKGSPVIDQGSYINEIYSELTAGNKVDILNVMKENKEESIYYKTDHHWTIYGAYLAYAELMKSIGEEPKELSFWGDSINVSDFYGTYFSKAKPFNGKADTLSYYEVPNISMKIETEVYDSLYDYEYLETRDKYSAFLRGNNALTVIKNEGVKNNKKALIIKDSFGNSLVPFLTAHYEEIHVVDLRAFMPKLNEYIKENKFDNVVILYNFMNFARDTNIVKLKY